MKQYLIQTFSQLKDSTIAILATFSLFLAPIAQVLVFVVILSILDLITGLSAAHKDKIAITSKKFGNTITKLFLYMGVLICAHYLDTNVLATLRTSFLDQLIGIFLSEDGMKTFALMKFTSAIGTLIIIREFMSIDENWNRYFGWSFIASFKDTLIKLFNKFKINANKT